MKTFLLAATLLASSSAIAGSSAILVDGDTFVLDGERIRIIETDTPETWRPRCEREYRLGLDAKAELRRLLDLVDEAHPLTVVREGTDYFKRTLAYVYVGEINVGESMIASGHALPYRKSKASKAWRLSQWCS
jgi:endonuclease YncB( thermonuclease family)